MATTEENDPASESDQASTDAMPDTIRMMLPDDPLPDALGAHHLTGMLHGMVYDRYRGKGGSAVEFLIGEDGSVLPAFLVTTASGVRFRVSVTPEPEQ